MAAVVSRKGYKSQLPLMTSEKEKNKRIFKIKFKKIISLILNKFSAVTL